ncbi:hypothetical protein BC830DRAFT_1168392 [Chytriomyces sp. MP71]|nr:hypothetical protein BC830DRAFT_1168392 [Chytriomyces sp. MP71]
MQGSDTNVGQGNQRGGAGWSVSEWRQQEQEARMRQAPAGLDTSLASSSHALLPSFAVRRPPSSGLAALLNMTSVMGARGPGVHGPGVGDGVPASDGIDWSRLPDKSLASAAVHSAFSPALPLFDTTLLAFEPRVSSLNPTSHRVASHPAVASFGFSPQLPHEYWPLQSSPLNPEASPFSGADAFLQNLDSTFLQPLFANMNVASPNRGDLSSQPVPPPAEPATPRFIAGSKLTPVLASATLESTLAQPKVLPVQSSATRPHLTISLAKRLFESQSSPPAQAPSVVPVTPVLVSARKDSSISVQSMESTATIISAGGTARAVLSSSKKASSKRAAKFTRVDFLNTSSPATSLDHPESFLTGEGNWSSALSKAAETITTLLKCDDCVTAGDADHAEIPFVMDASTGLPTAACLEAILRPLKKLADLQQTARLFAALNEEEDGWTKRLLNICERVMGACERRVAFGGEGTTSKTNGITGGAHWALGEVDCFSKGAMRLEASKDEVSVRFDEMCDASVLGLESAILALTLINQSGEHGGGDRKSYGEKTISSIVSFLHSRLLELLGAVRIYADESDVASLKSNHLRHLLDASDSKKRLVHIVGKLGKTLDQLGNLFQHHTFHDSVIVATYTMSVPVFFVESNSLSLYVGFEKLQMASIRVLSMIFAQAVGHRAPMLEEVAGHLLKLQSVKKGLRQYKLLNGKSIQMVSALLMQLIQATFVSTSTGDVVKEVKEFLILNQLGRDGNDASAKCSSGNDAAVQNDRVVVEKILSTAKRGIDSANSCVMFFLRYVISRAFPDASKGDKGASTPGRRSLVASTESELRVILENLVDDFLMVLGEPDWPAAEVMVVLMCKIVTHALDDKRSGDTAVKSFSLDFLGQLTARLFGLLDPAHLKLEAHISSTVLSSLTSEICQALDVVADPNMTSKIARLWEVQSAVIDYLKSERDNDCNCDAVCSFLTFSWIHSSAGLFSKISLISEPLKATVIGLMLEYCEAAETMIAHTRFKHLSLASLSIPMNVENPQLAKIASWCLFQRSQLQSIRETLLSYILASLDAESVTLRTRSLKALSDVVSVDAKVLRLASVKTVIGSRLLDSSKMVRDAAVELVGCYVTKDFNASLVSEYYPLLIPRILDVGSAVRKRIIKLAKDIALFAIANETSTGVAMDTHTIDRTVEVVVKIMGRVSDEENSIKELAYKSLVELWFSPFKHYVHVPASKHDDVLHDASLCSSSFALQPIQAKFEIKNRASLLLRIINSLTSGGVNMTAADGYGDCLKHVLESSIAKRGDVVSIARSLVECVSESILSYEEAGDKESIKNAFVFLNQVARVLPTLLLPHVRMLQTYLHSNSTGGSNGGDDRKDEEKITAAAVSILGYVIPFSLDPDLHMMAAIEGDLLTLLSRGSITVINLLVPCLTKIVHGVTKHYAKLTKVLRTCLENFGKSQELLQKGALNGNNLRAIARGLIIVSLLVRHFDFDRNRTLLQDQAAEDIARFPNVLMAVYNFVTLFAGPSFASELRTIALQALGNLYVAHPRLMTSPNSQILMNGIFDANFIPHKVELIKIFAEFLKAEQLRMMAEEQTKKAVLKTAKGVDIKVLIGNADEMADAGVSSAVIQLYLNHILGGMMHVDMTMSTTSFDAVCIIIEQGLAHPLMCVPYIVAMQTSPIASVRDRAILVYDNLAEKHQTFIHSRTGECVRRSFDYRSNLVAALSSSEGPQWVPGYSREVTELDEGVREESVAMLSNMYNKLQVKRQRRNDFLMTIVRSFDIDTDGVQDENAIRFGRFLAENLATLDYKSADEVMNIIYHICQVLSVSGETILKFADEWKAGSQTDEKLLFSASKSSVLLGMLVLLKTYLQKMFDLSESKCRRYTPAETGRNTEKARPALRQSKENLDWTHWPFADSRLLTSPQDMAAQLELFVELMNTDYYVSSAEDESMDFEEVEPTAEVGDDGIEAVLMSPAQKGKKRQSSAGIGPAKKTRRMWGGKLSGRPPSANVSFSADTPSGNERPKRRDSRSQSLAALSDSD